MATLTSIKPTFAGVLLGAVAAAGGGDKFLNDGNVLLYVKNGSGVSINVTVVASGAPGGLTITNPVIAVAAGAEKIIGPFDPKYFNDASGFVNLTYSAATSVTVSVIQEY